MMRRLALPDQRGNDIVKMPQLFFSDRDACPTFGKRLIIACVCGFGVVKVLFQCTVLLLSAPVTDIRRAFRFGAFILVKVFTESIAHGTAAALLILSRRITDTANVLFFTTKALTACIVVMICGSRPARGPMFSYLFGYGSRIFIEDSSDLTEVFALLQQRLDREALVKGEMFLIGHRQNSKKQERIGGILIRHIFEIIHGFTPQACTGDEIP